MGTLFVVATPIGNLEDLSARAIRVLNEVDLIAAEDTRHTKTLLTRYGIKRPLLSYHAFNEQQRLATLLETLATGDVALVTDAGTPAISDPGVAIVDAAWAAGHPVRPIPGPSALTAAVSASGIVDGPFAMLGFIPRKPKERALVLDRAAASGFALVIFEAANRLTNTLLDVAERLPRRRAAVFRELTKLHEECVHGSLEELAAHFAAHPPRGEVVIVIGGGEVDTLPVDLDELLRTEMETGASPSEAAKRVASATGQAKSEVYGRALAIKRDRSSQPD